MVLIVIKIGAPEEIRTPDLRFRRPLLYPSELLEHWSERWESNLQPIAYKAIALPVELYQHKMVQMEGLEPSKISLDGF